MKYLVKKVNFLTCFGKHFFKVPLYLMQNECLFGKKLQNKNLIHRCKKIVCYYCLYCNVQHTVLTKKSMIQDV